jgi:hypothetical protein
MNSATIADNEAPSISFTPTPVLNDLRLFLSNNVDANVYDLIDPEA